MSAVKLSIVIPYKQRLANIRLAFEGLANQTLGSSQFEVVVGAMEYCTDYVAACRDYADRLNIVSVMSSRNFEIPQARNLGMRQARGEVCVQMDADTLLPPWALENLYNRHFRFGQDVCVVGQVVGYGNNTDGDVHSIEALPYSAYSDALKDLGSHTGEPLDPRFRTPHIVPWSFGWTGLIALRMDSIRRHNLYFDEEFRGWGVDDLEWSYRICQSGIPIVLREDVCAFHLPHIRDAAANHQAGRRNFRRFLRKWPGPDVELAAAFDDFEANTFYVQFTRELAEATDGEGVYLGTIKGLIDNRPALVVGAPLNASHQLLDPLVLSRFDLGHEIDVLPLAGLALPFADKSVTQCQVLPAAMRLSDCFLQPLRAELDRVALRVVMPKVVARA